MSMYLYGTHSVRERLVNDPGSIKKVFLSSSRRESPIQELVHKNKIPLELLSDRELRALKPAANSQGVLARVSDFNYADYEGLLERAVKEAGQNQDTSPRVSQCFIYLDGLFDPQNLGAILRTAACFGGFSVVIPERRSCEVTEAVLRVAQGGENYVSVSKVVNLRGAVLQAKERGYWIAAGLPRGEKPLDKMDFSFPLGVIIGSEDKGVRYGLRKYTDFSFYIPMPGAKLSFNVAAASAVVCYEVFRQRGIK